MNSFKSCFFSLSCVLLVTACGGNGGGGPLTPIVPTTPVTINALNAESIVAELLGSAEAATGTSSGSGFVTGVSVSGGGGNFSYADLVLSQLGNPQLAGTLPATGSATGVVLGSRSASCDNSGGFVRYSGEVVDITLSTLYVDDFLNLRYIDCLLNGVLMNGRFNFIVTETTPSPFDGVAPFTFGIDVTLEGFTANDAGLVVSSDGDMSIIIDDDGAGAISIETFGTFLNTTVAGVSYHFANYSYHITGNIFTDDYSIDLNGTISSLGIGGAVIVTTITPFSGNLLAGNGDPTAGQIMITNSLDNSKALVIALPDGINVEILVDADGDGSYETLIPTTWAAL